MRQALKIYEGEGSVATTADDVESATLIFREELEELKRLFTRHDLTPFMDVNCNGEVRYKLLFDMAEYIFKECKTLSIQRNGGKSVESVPFRVYFLSVTKRMREAFDICQPAGGGLKEDESALAQCFMAIAGMVRKMAGTRKVDSPTMNRKVERMVAEALRYNKVESLLEIGKEEDIFSDEYTKGLNNIPMPATKLELLIKLLERQIKEYGKTNQIAAKKYGEMLKSTIDIYHERREKLPIEEAGETQEEVSEQIIQDATAQLLEILKGVKEDRKSFYKMGLTFEEKAFYDILIAMRDKHNFVYGSDKLVGDVVINDKCVALARKVKEIIERKTAYRDWLNNQNVRNQLKFEIKVCLVKAGYPPQYSPDVFRQVMKQVGNYKENN